MTNQKSFKALLQRCLIILLICISVLVYQYASITSISNDAVIRLGDAYTSSYSKQVQVYLNSVLANKRESISTLYQTVSWSSKDESKLFQTLAYNARNREVESLLLMREDGVLDPIYGEVVTLHNVEGALAAANNNNQKIALGHTASKQSMVLTCLPLDYTAESGIHYIMLVAAKDTKTLTKDITIPSAIPIMCGLYTDDGMFVSGSIHQDINTQLMQLLFNGTQAPIDYNRTLDLAVSDNTYKAYISPIPNTQWLFVTCIDYGLIESTLTSLSRQHIALNISCSIIILIAVLYGVLHYANLLKENLKEVRTLHQDLQQAQDAQRAFLSNLSHDIKTPMNGIIGMILLAQNNIDDVSQIKYYLDKMDTSSQYMLGLINNLLDLSKIEQEGLDIIEEPVSLYNLLLRTEDVMLSNIQSKNQRFIFEADSAGDDFVWCDSNRLQQVLINILSNSVQYTGENGTIRLSCEVTDIDEEYKSISITIDDNGEGMSDDTKSKIFDAFVREDADRTTKNNGIGIGLTITNYIVRMMSGTITVNSELGKGTQFIVNLKLKKVSEDLMMTAYKELDVVIEDDDDVDYTQIDITAKKILIAEDNELNYEILSELLLCFGLELTWAINGQIAVDMFSSSELNYFDVILMDLRMPVMNGYQAAEEIRKLDRADAQTIPIIAVSADSFEEDVKRCMECGMNAHTHKPVDIEEVLLLIRKYIYHREV